MRFFLRKTVVNLLLFTFFTTTFFLLKHRPKLYDLSDARRDAIANLLKHPHNDSSHSLDPARILTLFSKKELMERINKIKPPPIEKLVWAVPSRNQLSIAIIEPRNHVSLQGILSNFAHVYGGTEVALYIFHGNLNLGFIKQITDVWKNIQYVNLNVSILEYPISESFYKHFTSEFVLIFQTDTLIRHSIPQHFFLFDYVGAPWTHNPIPTAEHQVGNGGFSLRRVSTMLAITGRNETAYENEDLFIVRRLRKGSLPPVAIAKEFAAEMQTGVDPVGLHQVYKFLGMDELMRLLAGVAGLEYL